MQGESFGIFKYSIENILFLLKSYLRFCSVFGIAVIR